MKKLLVLTAMLALAASAAATAAGGIQQLEAEVTPTKLDGRKFTPARLFVDVFTATNDESAANGEEPPTTERMRFDFPRNLRFDPGAVPRCKVSAGELRNKGAAQREQLCGHAAKVSIDNGSSAEITDDPPLVLPPQVTEAALQVFNGKRRNTLYFAVDPEGPTFGPVLVGMLGKSNAGAGYGRQLDVDVPSPPSGAFSDIKFTIKAGSYLRARCRSRTNRFLVRTNFADHSPSAVVDASVCKRKKNQR